MRSSSEPRILHFAAADPNEEQDQARTHPFGHTLSDTLWPAPPAFLFLSTPMISTGGLLLFWLCSAQKAEL